MLHKSSSSKKQLWVYTLVLPQLITLLHFFSFEKYYIPEVSVDNVTTDTIPYNIVEIETSDTVLVFDSDSKTEKLVYLKSSEKFVEHLDTNVVTDRVTGEKALIVNSTFIPLDEYKAAMKRIEYPKGQPNLDTIVLIDYDTFEETVSIIEPTHECFTFFWGNRAFSNSHKISLETFKKIFARDLTLTSTCNDQTIKSYEFRVVFIDKGKDALVLNITKAKQKIDQDFIKIENIKDGSIIFIEDITVNDQVSLPGIQIFIEN